jgi:hypothetical protein
VGLVLARLDKGIGARIQSFFLKDGLTRLGLAFGRVEEQFQTEGFRGRRTAPSVGVHIL